MSAQPRGHEAAPADGVVQQALRRVVNEQISSLNADGVRIDGSATIDVLCECVRGACTARITMTVADYELVRRFPTRFFVKAGHEVAEEERVVEESHGYVVIEARGRRGLWAVSADPRSPYRRRTEVGA